MQNNQHPYLFRNVSEDDYAFLQEAESHIWEEVKRKLYAEGVSIGEKELERNRPHITYSPKNQILAISVGVKQERRRILSGIDFVLMSDLEKKMYSSMRHVLSDCLEGIKLKKEDWK